MTDENRPEGQPAEETPPSPESATAVATPPDEPTTESTKLNQTVEIKDTGPCKKHIKVVIDRKDIDGRMGELFKKLVHESNVTGFRPGKAPKKLVEKRFYREVADQVKREVLLASLDQLGNEHDVAPLAPPEIDIDQLEIPREGPMVYEFEVEVRPEFDLPPYRNLQLKKPTKTFSDAEVADTRRHILARYGQIVPKEGGTVELGDIVVADVTIRHDDTVVGFIQETQLRIERRLAFKDGIIDKFDEHMKGAKVGETRVMDCQLSSTAAQGWANRTVKAHVHVKDIKTVRPPELTEEFCQKTLGINSPEMLDEVIRATLERNLEHAQRRSARVQIMQQLTANAKWELPKDLLMRNYRRVRSRRIMEMKGDGLSEEQIGKQIRVMEQDLLNSTSVAMKEYFVLQKIAEVEKFDVTEEDINDEIDRIAEESGESPRRVRARLEKEDMIEALMADMLERKALDLILDNASWVEEPIDKQQQEEATATAEMATVEAQAVPGEMLDPTAPAPEPEATPESQEGQ